MAIAHINRGGINSGPINGPPSIYVDGAAQLLHDETFGGDAEVNQLYWNSAAALTHGHSLDGNAQSKVFGRGGINSRQINSGQINGEYGVYVSAKATLQHVHTLPADLTFGSDTIIFGSSEMSHGHTLSADLTFFQNYYSDGAAVLTHPHTLTGDLSFFYSTIVYGDSTMTHGHTLVADLTFGYEFFVNGSASLSHGHTFSGNGQMVIQGSSSLGQDHTLSGDLTFGSDIVIYGNVTFSHDHTLTGDLFQYIPIDASINLVTNHTFGGDLTLLPFNDASATMTHDHDLEWTDTQSVLAQATMTHSHVLFGSALGGTPQIDIDNLWTAAEPYPDIEIRNLENRKVQFFGLNYDVDGFQYSYSGLDFCALNSSPLDQACGTFPAPDLAGQLDMEYGLGETQGSLDLKYSFMYDVDEQTGSLDMKYDLDVGTQALQKGSIGMKVGAWHKTVLEEMLVLVNDARSDLGLIPYTLYTGIGEDVATTHSENMASTGIFAHEDGGFPAGYQNESQRISHIAESPTGYAENLALTASADRHFATAAELFNAWWNSPTHKANMLYPWTVDDAPQMLLGYGFRYDWSGAPGLWSTFYTQLFISYGIPAGATLTEGQLDITYALDTSLVCSLHVGYALDAYTQAQRQHSSVYGITVSTQNEVPYGARVAAQHTAPIHFNLQTQHQADYGGLEFLKLQHEIEYSLAQYTPVTNQMDQGYNVSVAAQNSTVFSYMQPFQVQHDAGYDLLEYTPVLNSSANPYAISVSAQNEADWTAYEYVQHQNEAPYEPSVLVIHQNEHKFDLLGYNPVRKTQTLYYAMIDSTVTVTTSFAILTLKR